VNILVISLVGRLSDDFDAGEFVAAGGHVKNAREAFGAVDDRDRTSHCIPEMRFADHTPELPALVRADDPPSQPNDSTVVSVAIPPLWCRYPSVCRPVIVPISNLTIVTSTSSIASPKTRTGEKWRLISAVSNRPCSVSGSSTSRPVMTILQESSPRGSSVGSAP
jgi:hypothetical protein